MLSQREQADGDDPAGDETAQSEDDELFPEQREEKGRPVVLARPVGREEIAIRAFPVEDPIRAVETEPLVRRD